MPVLGFYSTYAYMIRPRTTNFGVVTHMGKGCFRQTATPLHLHKCTNASRDLSATADFYRATLCVSTVTRVFAVVRSSVRPSITLVHCIQMAEVIVKLLYLPGSTIVLVF